jgi:hypothetical protein
MLVEPEIIKMLHFDNNLALRTLLNNSPEIAVLLLKYDNVRESIAGGNNIVLAKALQCGLIRFAEHLCKLESVQEGLKSLEGDVLFEAASTGQKTLVDNIWGRCTISSAEDNTKILDAERVARSHGHANIARSLHNRSIRFLYGSLSDQTEEERRYESLGFSTVNLKDVHPLETTLLQFTKRLEDDFKDDEVSALSTRRECSIFLRRVSG